jgi:hypothetical protein
MDPTPRYSKPLDYLQRIAAMCNLSEEFEEAIGNDEAYSIVPALVEKMRPTEVVFGSYMFKGRDGGWFKAWTEPRQNRRVLCFSSCSAVTGALVGKVSRFDSAGELPDDPADERKKNQ